MAVITAAGSVIAISSVLSGTAVTNDWKIIGETVSVGEFGREYTEITHNPLDTRRTEKFKGSYNEGNLTLSLGRDISDVGQALALVASKSDASYGFRITLNDAPSSGGSPHGTWFKFDGKVMSFKNSIPGVNSIVGATITISIDSDIVEVAAAGTTP